MKIVSIEKKKKKLTESMKTVNVKNLLGSPSLDLRSP